ncbi:MAG: M20 family peptidase [Hyphomonas sp.]
MIKKLGLGFVGATALLVGVILVRTFTYGGTEVGERLDVVAAPDVSAETAALHLSEAIQMKTITLQAGDPRVGQEGPWLELHSWLEATYPAAHATMERQLVPGTLSLLYTWQGSDKNLAPLLLMAHQDVVPVNMGTESDWTGPPFAGKIIDGYVYGRGAIDDKNSLVALMEAAEALAKDGFTPQRTVMFMFGHDEEVSGSGAQAAIALLKARSVRPEMVLDEGFMIIDPSPITGKTMGFIGIAEKGYITLKLTASADGGHSSTPPRNSAAVRLANAIVALENNQMPANYKTQPVAGMFATSAPDMPFAQRMALANMWLFGGMVDKSMAGIPAANAMVRTTTAPTMLTGSAKENVLPQRAQAIVNFRIHPNDTPESVEAHVKRVTKDIDGLSVEVSGDSIGSPASPLSPTDNRPYSVLASVAAHASDGAPITPGLVLGATDARFASEISDNVYRFAPAVLTDDELTGFHGTNERISVENMKRMSEAYAQIILMMDAPD